MTMTFDQYTEQVKAGDRQAFLGMICWFAVSEDNVPHKLVENQLADVALERFCPAPPQDDDVFRRVFYNGQRRKLGTDDPEVLEHLLIRQVSHKDKRVVKRVVIETVDSAGHKLGYREACEIVFESARPSEIDVTPMGGDENARGWDLAMTLVAEYKQERGQVAARSMREMVRQVLSAAMATSLRPGGGVYFVPMGRAELVDALETAAPNLPGVFFQTHPLLDEAKQVDLVRKAFEAETEGEIERMITEIADLVNAKKSIDFKQYSRFVDRSQEITARTKEYSTLLSRTLGRAEDGLQLLGLEIANLLSAVKA